MTETAKQYKRRRRAELFKEQGGDCYWCHEPMVLLEPYPPGPVAPDVCTLDHLFDRTHPQRRTITHGIERYVAACNQCNHDRGHVTSKRFHLAQAMKQEIDRLTRRDADEVYFD